MARPEKVAKVEALSAKLAESQGAILINYRGLNVSEQAALRKAIKESGAELTVVKNTFFRRALAGTDAEGLAEYVAGPIGVTFCPDDVGAPAKALVECAKEQKLLEIIGAWGDGQIYDEKQIRARAEMPGRDELLGQLARVLNAPIAGLAQSLNGVVPKFARALSAVAEKKEAAA